MESNFERNRFRMIYWTVAALFLILLGAWSYFAVGKFTIGMIGVLVIAGIFVVVVYIIVYRMLDKAYGNMENVSQIMSDITEKGIEPPSEEYKEGTIGILYSNFYKMVYALKESRNREMEEKIFLRDIISDISHQLKTPLASLNVFVDLLVEDKVEDEAKRKQVLREAQNQLNRMEWMVLSMLKLARIEAGAIQFEQKERPLYPLLYEAMQSVEYLTNKRNQTITIECPDNCELLCDGDWLIEAVINLLKNASDYSGEGKPIRIEVEQSKVYCRIYIKDEGPGIPESEIPNIFKRFYRVHQEVNPNSVGIGLSLTKSIVEGMGGSIRVNSEEGKYTWFALTFVE
ncbi:MAG: HAMP domain-containing histidine kinase [Lachnospiraceae bacterium]|nr:HAMP domain-containing histidine kinase [Lachnospiraceae bacterium]